MEYFSTRGDSTPSTSSQAILQGLAPDGGLLIPQAVPALDHHDLQGLDYCAMGAKILSLFLTDHDPAFLEKALRDAYGKKNFPDKILDLHPLQEGLFSLELWHGPTCAFKDFALMAMPRLLLESKRMNARQEETVVLVATSGDTGKAALVGYRDLPGVKIAVFYPDGGTSDIQRLQMVSQQGGNVQVFAVKGNFDDAQTAVKKAFHSPALARELAGKGQQLTSANSINWGRLVPQIIYYFTAYLRLVESGAVADGAPVDFCVPTGNFGDIMAGFYAKKMGLPVGKLICASNQNNVLADFFATGVYDAGRPFYRTASPSMDILISSNLERLLAHTMGRGEAVAACYRALSAERRFALPPEVMETLRADFSAYWADDAAAMKMISDTYRSQGYLCDPHTAVALCAARDHRRAGGHVPCVVLSTASPYKFSDKVLAALGQPVQEKEFEALHALEAYTGIPAPPQLSALEHMPVRFSRVISPQMVEEAARCL